MLISYDSFQFDNYLHDVLTQTDLRIICESFVTDHVISDVTRMDDVDVLFTDSMMIAYLFQTYTDNISFESPELLSYTEQLLSQMR